MFRTLALGGGFILLCLIAYPLVVSLGRKLSKDSRKIWAEADEEPSVTTEPEETMAKVESPE